MARLKWKRTLVWCDCWKYIHLEERTVQVYNHHFSPIHTHVPLTRESDVVHVDWCPPPVDRKVINHHLLIHCVSGKQLWANQVDISLLVDEFLRSHRLRELWQCVGYVRSRVEQVGSLETDLVTSTNPSAPEQGVVREDGASRLSEIRKS